MRGRFAKPPASIGFSRPPGPGTAGSIPALHLASTARSRPHSERLSASPQPQTPRRAAILAAVPEPSAPENPRPFRSGSPLSDDCRHPQSPPIPIPAKIAAQDVADVIVFLKKQAGVDRHPAHPCCELTMAAAVRPSMVPSSEDRAPGKIFKKDVRFPTRRAVREVTGRDRLLR
jgi:hypothetical protein